MLQLQGSSARFAGGADSFGPALGHLLPGLLLCAVWIAPAAAQSSGPAFWVSTTSDVGSLAGDQPAATDSTLMRVQAGQLPQPVCFDGHWRALGALLPTDIDGLAIGAASNASGGAIPGGSLGALHFSLLSNQGSFEDGDVLRLAAGGGFEVAFSEEQLSIELGTPDAAIDLDAIGFDEQGRLLFSLQNNLVGTVLGDVSDGDVLYRDGLGGIHRRLTEAQVLEAFVAAGGSASSIGDVLGLHVDGSGLWVTVQSPSSADGGVLLTEGTPLWIPEDELGLDGAELDALTGPPPIAEPSAWVLPQTSGSMRGRIEGATPGGLLVVLAAGQPGYQAVPGLGAFFLDALDPHLASVLSGPGPSLVLADGAGSVDVTFDLPKVGAGSGWDGSEGWSFQVIDLGSATLSAPYRVDV